MFLNEISQLLTYIIAYFKDLTSQRKRKVALIHQLFLGSIHLSLGGRTLIQVVWRIKLPASHPV